MANRNVRLFILLFGPMIRTIIKYNKIVYNLSIDKFVYIVYNNNVLKVQCSKVVNRVTRKPTEKNKNKMKRLKGE